MLAAAWALPAGAAESPMAPAVPKRRVVVLPGRDYRIDPDRLFTESEPAASPDPGAALAEAAASVLAGEPEVALVRPKDLRSGTEGVESPELVVRGLLHLGQERYRDIRIPDALVALEQGISAARRVFLDLVSPDLVSDLYLYQGLCYLEQGQPAMAHVAFKNLLMATPRRTFRKGYFPPATETAMRTAAEDFVRTMTRDNPLGGMGRAETFLKLAKATAAVSVSLSGSPGEKGMVDVRVVEVARQPGGHLALAARAESEWKDAETAADLVSRAVSGWLACTTLPSREASEPAMPRFYLDTSGAYSVFLRVPTRRIFSNAGFGIGLSWQAMKGLDVFARLNLLNAFEDPYGDLVKQFWTVRGLLGVGYSMQWKWGRVFLHTGFAFDYLSGFESTTDPNCKFWPGDEERCSASNVRRPRYLFGMAVTLGLNVNLGGPIFLAFQTGVGTYFLSNEADTPLNFPFSLELGLGFKFD